MKNPAKICSSVQSVCSAWTVQNHSSVNKSIFVQIFNVNLVLFLSSIIIIILLSYHYHVNVGLGKRLKPGSPLQKLPLCISRIYSNEHKSSITQRRITSLLSLVSHQLFTYYCLSLTFSSGVQICIHISVELFYENVFCFK